MRRCTTCREEFPLDGFHQESSKKGTRRYICKGCADVYRRVYNASEHGQRMNRDRMLRHNYGVTLVEYEAIAASQRDRCAICGLPETARSWKTGAVKLLAVDHDHVTGRVRGLLCQRCNIGLGHLATPELLDAAAAYLHAVSVSV